MMKNVFIYTLLLLYSCQQNRKQSVIIEKTDSPITESKSPVSESLSPTDKTVKFLWRENKYDDTLKETLNFIRIDEALCSRITNVEKAALGYVATFIGNECIWDGEYTDDRSNLKCKVLTALKLGYQCSDQHLGFLRKMFRNDPEVLEELKTDNCPTTPDGATMQESFDEISLLVNGSDIQVSFTASGINSREGKSWSWTETDFFQTDQGTLLLIKKEKSELKFENLKIEE